jgi:hypothetical protein
MATAEEALISTDNDPQTVEHRQRQSRRLWQTIGATKLADRLSSALASQSIRALGRSRDDKEYLAEGFKTFEDLLDLHPESPMSYDQFNRREKLLDKEGDLVFDLLSSLDVPMKARKLLAGEIEVDGNELRVGDAHCCLDDDASVLNLITTQHAKLLEQQRTIDRGKKDVEKHKRLAIEAEKRVATANPTGTPTGQALMTASGALSQLREALAAASDDEKQALREPVFELLRMNQLECSVALGIIKESDLPPSAAAEVPDELD